jgi:PIN domain nuclease of toxin-antitoxin system
MKRLLLDSHTLIWFFEDDTRLPTHIKSLIEDADNEVFVSIASFREIAIKKSLQKLTLQKSLAAMFEACSVEQIEILPVHQPQIEWVETLPFHHRDPFDRILVAACLSEGLEILGADSQFDAYGVRRIW